MKKLLLGIIGAIVSLTIGVLVLTHGNPLNWKNGLWRFFGFEPMTTYHSFVVDSPDGRVKSKVTEWMDPDNDTVVHVRIEQLTGTTKRSRVTCRFLSTRNYGNG